MFIGFLKDLLERGRDDVSVTFRYGIEGSSKVSSGPRTNSANANSKTECLRILATHIFTLLLKKEFSISRTQSFSLIYLIVGVYSLCRNPLEILWISLFISKLK